MTHLGEAERMPHKRFIGDEEWDMIRSKLPAQHVARLKFASDMDGYRKWLEYRESPEDWYHHSYPDDIHSVEQFVRNASNLRFLSSNGRYETLLDHEIMWNLYLTLIQQISRAIWDYSARQEFTKLDDKELEASLIKEVTSLLESFSEDQLREWATRAMYRPGIALDVSDLEGLRASVRAYADSVLQEALRHIAAGVFDADTE